MAQRTSTRAARSSKAQKADRLTEAARVMARLARTVERACQESGISLPQYRILLFIAHQPARAGVLARKAAVSRPALTDLVDGLERQGFLKRVPVEGDRRGIGLELTPTGADAMHRAERTMSANLASLADEGLVQKLADLRTKLDAELERHLKEVSEGEGS